MFYGFFIFIHIIICVFLIIIVLIQAGRGGGLSESFSNAESVFGTKTNAFLVRATTVLAISFFISCLSLAFLSKQKTKSILKDTKAIKTKITNTTVETKAGPETAKTENTAVSKKESPAAIPAENVPANETKKESAEQAPMSGAALENKKPEEKPAVTPESAK